MQQSQFLNGLLNETEESLKQQLHLWDSSGVWTTVGKRATEKLKTKFPDQLTFQEALKEPWRNLKDPQLADFQIMKLSRLMTAADISFPYKPSTAVLHDCTIQLENKAIEFLKKDDKKFTGNAITDMTRYVTEKMFDELTEKFKKAEPGKRDVIVGKILEAIDTLGDADKKRLLEKLDVEELSKDQLALLIKTGSFAAGIAAVVSVAGFPAYIALVSGVASAASLIGVTLPFATYMYATSTLAFVSNPFTLLLGGVGLGAWLTARSNKTIYRRLVPMLVSFSHMNQTALRNSDDLVGSFAARIQFNQDELDFGDQSRRKALKKCFPGITQ